MCECISEWGLNRSHRSSVLRRLSDRSARMPYCDVLHVSSPSCSWIQATAVFSSIQIQVRSTCTREIARSMLGFQQSETYAYHWDLRAPVCHSSFRCYLFHSEHYVWQIRSWIRNGLVCELPIDHIVLGCQSFPGLTPNLTLSSSLRVDSIFVAIRIHLY